LCSSVDFNMVCAEAIIVSQTSLLPYKLIAGYMFRLLINLEDGGSTFPRNVRKLLPDYVASHPRK
jgi:hypothetical protein